MEQAQSEREIIDLEHAYWRAIQEQDVDTAMELTDERCVVTGAQGYASLERDQFAQMAVRAAHRTSAKLRRSRSRVTAIIKN